MEVLFCPVLPDNENSFGLFEGFQVLPASPSHKISIKMRISTECLVQWYWQGKTEVFGGNPRNSVAFHSTNLACENLVIL